MRITKIISIVVVLALLLQVLPMQILGTELRTALADENVEMVTTTTDASVKIAGEVVENRTRFSKEYTLTNGLHMAVVYPEAVHYENDGQWLEIDNTLKAVGTGATGIYTNRAGEWSVSFPQQLSQDNRVAITKNGYAVRFGMAGELRKEASAAKAATSLETETVSVVAVKSASAQVQTLETANREDLQFPETVQDKVRSRLQYSTVYSQTDIVYDVTPSQIKESIVIRSFDPQVQGYRYVLELDGLTPVLNSDNSIDLVDPETKETVMQMPAPYMVDAGGATSTEVEVSLKQDGDDYLLLYAMPAQWLADEDRQWPVILDPIVTASTNVTNIKDQTVMENHSIAYNSGALFTGYYSNYGKMRTYLQYVDLPDLTSADVVVSASISLKINTNSGTGVVVSSETDTPIEVHSVEAAWNSDTITWANKPAIGDAVQDYAVVSNSGRHYWDVTDLVRNWYAGTNTGMAFKATDAVENGTANDFKKFFSSDYSTYDTGISPQLHIIFRNSNGLESYWDYTTSSAGRAGTGYVNNYSGNLVWVRNDLGFGGNRMPVSISHIYNANDGGANAYGVGSGWKTNYHQKVYAWNNTASAREYFAWVDGDGTTHYFEKQSDGTYKDEDGLELTLTRTSSGTNLSCNIADQYDNRSYFDNDGRLIKQENKQQTKSSVEITYDSNGKIANIEDGAGRNYVFTYENGNLSRISYKGTGSTEISYVAFTYSGSYLTKITDADGGTTKFAYNGKNILSKITDVDGYYLQYTYNTTASKLPSRISKVVEGDGTAEGGSMSFSYAHNQTTVTDKEGNKQVLQFNNWGNTVSIHDNQGRAQYGQYALNDPTDEEGTQAILNADPAAKGNQLRVSSKMQNTVGNMLAYGSFEAGSAWTALNSSVTSAISSDASYHGSKSLAVTRTAAGTASGAYISFSADKKETYTFSAYVKTGDGSAWLALNTGSTTVKSEVLEANSGWTRLQVTYTNSTSSAKTVTARLMTAEAGTVYLDCAQIEKAPTASRYNLVENGDFRYENSPWSSNFGRVTKTAAAPELESTVYKIAGAYGSAKWVTQTVKVSGSKGDSFVLGGWAKGDSVPLGDIGGVTREFAIQAFFNYTDGTTSDPFTARFNPDVETWQYSCTAMVAKKAYSSITVRFAYDYNANTAWFDGIQLFKETFGSSYTYNTNGDITKTVDLQGEETKFTYDGVDLKSVVQGSITKASYVYDTNHNVTQLTTLENQIYNFEYDTYGNNTKVSITANGLTLSATAAYTNSGNCLDYTLDAMGYKTDYTYDANTNVLKTVKYPNDASTSPDTRTHYTYDELYRVASVAATTNKGSALSASYTYTNDNLTKIETGTTTYNFTYSNFSLRNAVKVGSRTLASYTYDDVYNRLTKLTYGNGDFVGYTYDSYGRVSKETYEDGDFVTYLYDNDGGLGSVTDSSSGTITSFFYDLAGRLVGTRRTGENGEHSVAYIYNSKNLLVRHKETFDNTTRTVYYGYDSYDRLKSITEGSSKETYAYDDFGRLSTSTLTHGGAEVMKETYGYRGTSTTTTGQVSTLTITTPGAYQANYAYTYDPNGNIKTVTDAAGTTTYYYDTANQLLRENNQAAGKTWVYTYDNGGNILSRTEYAYTTGTPGTPLDTVTYVYGNTTWGDLLTKHDGNTVTNDVNGNMTAYGKTKTYTWEHGRELASLTQPAPMAITKQPSDVKGILGTAISFSVTAKGEGLSYQWQVSSNGGSTWGDTSANGYNTNTISGFTMTEARDGNMYRCIVTDANGNIRVSDAAEIVLVPIAITKQPSNCYGSVGTPVTFSVTAQGSNLSYQWQVSTNGGSTWGNTSANGATTNTISGFDITEARDGNMYRCVITDGNGNSVTSSAKSIIATDLAITKQPGTFKGLLGDTVTLSVNVYGSDLTYRWQVSTDGGETWSNSSATGYNTKTISGFELTESRNGNMYRCVVTDGDGNTVTSNAGEISVITETWQYTYDADGLRTKATNGHNTYEYTYDGGKLTSMKVDDKVLYFFYDGNGKPWYFLYNNTKYFYATNLQGDVTAIMTVSGSTKVKYTYDAWGNILSVTGANATTIGRLNPLRYRGYVYDQPTQLYYLQSRYYAPELGRFISADVYPTTGQGLTGNNMFAYCGNNPVSRSDDGGEWWHLVVGAIVGVVSQYVSDVVSNLASGESFADALVPTSSAVDYLAAAASGALAASGVGAFGSAIANAAIDGVAYVANCGINGEEVNGSELLFTVATSALTSGKGVDGANLRGVYKRSKQVLKTAVSPKKIAMYTAKKKKVVTTVIGEISLSLLHSVKDGFNRDTGRRLDELMR